jgi:hypothetical protein
MLECPSSQADDTPFNIQHSSFNISSEGALADKLACPELVERAGGVLK